MVASSENAPLKFSIESILAESPVALQQQSHEKETVFFQNLWEQHQMLFYRQDLLENQQHELWRIGLMFLKSQQPDMPLLYALPHLPQLLHYVGNPASRKPKELRTNGVSPFLEPQIFRPSRSHVGPQNSGPSPCRGRPPRDYSIIPMNQASPRHEYTPWQLEQLEARYKISPKCGFQDACEMGSTLGVPAKKLISWFSRRRQADREGRNGMGR